MLVDDDAAWSGKLRKPKAPPCLIRTLSDIPLAPDVRSHPQRRRVPVAARPHRVQTRSPRKLAASEVRLHLKHRVDRLDQLSRESYAFPALACSQGRAGSCESCARECRRVGVSAFGPCSSIVDCHRDGGSQRGSVGRRSGEPDS